MDPDATLKEIRALTTQILNGNYGASAAPRLAELVHALDEWIVSGGFFPAVWSDPLWSDPPEET